MVPRVAGYAELTIQSGTKQGPCEASNDTVDGVCARAFPPHATSIFLHASLADMLFCMRCGSPYDVLGAFVHANHLLRTFPVMKSLP
jgi:hypothetical protein